MLREQFIMSGSEAKMPSPENGKGLFHYAAKVQRLGAEFHRVERFDQDQ